MLNKSNLKQKPETAIEQAVDDRIVQVVLNERNEAKLVCPSCNNCVIKDLGKIAHTRAAIQFKCKCKCGHVYRVSVERRIFFRVSVNLTGICLYSDGDGKIKKGLIRVLDVSMSGLQFSVNSLPAFKVGDRITVEFRLDDWERSKVREEGIVRRIQSNKVGLQFDSVDRFGKIGLYLLG